MDKIKDLPIKRVYDYKSYIDITEALLLDGKTTGNDQREEMVEYTRINLQRMKRIAKTISISSAINKSISNYNRDVDWLLITEAWCGDAAQNLPIIHLFAAQSKHINLHIILRDEHPEIMSLYQTNGANAIPKLIAFDKNTQEELAVWGPRPKPLQEMVIANKNSSNPLPYSEFSVVVQKWYNNDKGQTLQQELLKLLL